MRYDHGGQGPRLDNDVDSARAHDIEALRTVADVSPASPVFLDLDVTQRLLNGFFRMNAELQKAMFGFEPPGGLPCVYVTIPYDDIGRLRRLLGSCAEYAGLSEIVVLGKHAKRTGAIVVPAKPIIQSLDRLMAPFANRGAIGICKRDLSSGLQFSSQEWTSDRTLLDEDSIYRLWHIFAWGEMVDWCCSG